MKGSATKIPGVSFAPISDSTLERMFAFQASAARVKRALPPAYRERIQIIVPRVAIHNAPPRLQ